MDSLAKKSKLEKKPTPKKTNRKLKKMLLIDECFYARISKYKEI